jgi:hypothetical protein
MAPLFKKWFKATGDLHPRIAGHLLTTSFGQPVVQTLARLDWDGNFSACIGLELSPDNNHVARSEFMLRGVPTKEPVEIQADNLWATARPGVKLTIHIPDGSAFKFTGGTLASDFVAAEDFHHTFTKDGNVIVPTERAANGVGDISIRVICHLDKTSNVRGPCIKATFLVFPHSVDELSELSAATLSPAWPGLRILENSCEFFPKNKDWKDPCCPLIMLGCTRLDNTNLPPGPEIRFQIAALMRSARRPTICTKLKTLTKQLEKAMTNVEELEEGLGRLVRAAAGTQRSCSFPFPGTPCKSEVPMSLVVSPH